MSKPKNWDLIQERLFINILQTEDVLGEFESLDVKVRVIVDSKKVYSTKLKNIRTSQPVIWNESFFIKSSPHVLFQLKSSDAVLYEYYKTFNDNVPEIKYEETLKLTPIFKKKVSSNAKLKIRFVLSNAPKYRNNENIDIIDLHMGNSRVNKAEFGDLLLYSGVSMLDTLLKIETGLQYTCVGFIIELPNKYTNELEHYVVEVTQNLNSNIDSISETKKTGVCIFKLEERIHSYAGTSIHLKKCTLKFDSELKEKIVEYILKLHSQDNLETNSPNEIFNNVKISNEKLRLIQDFYKEKNDKEKMMEYLGPFIIGKILQHIGWMNNDKDEASIDLEDILKLDQYKNGQLILLRTLKSAKEYYKDQIGENVKEISIKRYFLNIEKLLPSKKTFEKQTSQINSYKELTSGKTSKKESKKESSKSTRKDIKNNNSNEKIE